VQPFIQQLSVKTGETVNFSVLDGHEVVYLGRSNSPRLVSIGFHAGARAPAHVVAPGVVLTSQLTDEALEAWCHAHDFVAFTGRTVTDPARFMAQARAARTQGHWVLDKQLDAGFTGVAVPLTDRRGRGHGAIGMTLQSSIWNKADIEAQLLPPLLATATSVRPVL
jgi:IclR family pca regulon transcriptional regulator